MRVVGIGSIGSIKQIPPSLFAQCRLHTGTGFMRYVGADLTWMYISDNNPSVPGAGPILEVRTSKLGFGLQAGLGYALTRHWSLNAEVKHI